MSAQQFIPCRCWAAQAAEHAAGDGWRQAPAGPGPGSHAAQLHAHRRSAPRLRPGSQLHSCQPAQCEFWRRIRQQGCQAAGCCVARPVSHAPAALQVDEAARARLGALLAAEAASGEPASLHHLPHLNLWTKLRPGVRAFLEAAHAHFELHIYTHGEALYARAMAALLDPGGRLFAERILSQARRAGCCRCRVCTACAPAKTQGVPAAPRMHSAWLPGTLPLLQDFARILEPLGADRYGLHWPASRSGGVGRRRTAGSGM